MPRRGEQRFHLQPGQCEPPRENAGGTLRLELSQLPSFSLSKRKGLENNDTVSDLFENDYEALSDNPERLWQRRMTGTTATGP